MLIGAEAPNKVTWGFSAPPLKPEFTMLLMNGAFALSKIWCGAEESEAGCVQLWFSIAITNTVLIGSAFAIPLQISKVNTTLAIAYIRTRNNREENKEGPLFRHPSDGLSLEPIQARKVLLNIGLQSFAE